MEIQAVNSINTINFGAKTAVTKKCFAAGEKYSRRVVSEAIRLLETNEPVFPENYRKSFGQCLSEVKFQPVAWTTAKVINFINGKNEEIEDVSVDEMRGLLAIVTLGISELLKLPEAGIRKLLNSLTINSYSKKVSECLEKFKGEK